MMVFITYFLLSLMLAISPGPDILFVFVQSLQHQWRIGMIVVLGLCTGLFFHMIFALLGVNTLLLASPNALIFIQAIGAIYLCYLSYQSFAAFRAGTSILSSVKPEQAQAPAQKNLSWFYLRGFVLNITNPKVLLFFIAVLPQFIDPTMPHISVTMQTVIFGLLSILATFICFSSVTMLTGTFSVYLMRRKHAGNAINLFSALIFISLALYLLFSNVAILG